MERRRGAGFRACLLGRSVGGPAGGHGRVHGYQWGQVTCQGSGTKAFGSLIKIIWVTTKRLFHLKGTILAPTKTPTILARFGPAGTHGRVNGRQWGQVRCCASETKALGSSMLTIWLGSHPWNHAERSRSVCFRVCLHGGPLLAGGPVSGTQITDPILWDLAGSPP